MREKKRLNDLIKRYKIYGHIIILFIGMVLVAVITSISDLSPHMYNIGMGIGCSVMAAPIVSLIRIFLISDEVDEKTLVEEWGIIKIYDKKNYMEVTSQRFPKSRLDFVAFGLSDFRRENEKNIIIKKMKKD